MNPLRVEGRRGQHFDWVLAGIVVILMAMGLVNLVSAAASGVEGGSDIVTRQIMVMGLCFVVIAIVVIIDYRHYERFAYVLYGGTIALLLLTLVIAEETRGARAWLFSGRFQPSEVAKIGMVIAMAHYFSRNPPSMIRRLRDLFVPSLIVALPVAMRLAVSFLRATSPGAPSPTSRTRRGVLPQTRVAQCGGGVRRLLADSSRAGCATELRARGYPITKIMDSGRWSSCQSLQMFLDAAGAITTWEQLSALGRLGQWVQDDFAWPCAGW